MEYQADNEEVVLRVINAYSDNSSNRSEKPAEVKYEFSGQIGGDRLHDEKLSVSDARDNRIKQL